MYRRHFPLDIKGRSSHDVVVICVDHHTEYEAVATELKNKLNVEITGERIVSEAKPGLHVARYCRTLCNNSHRIPEDRKQEMIKYVAEHIGGEVTTERMYDFYQEYEASNGSAPGKVVVDNLKTKQDIQDFIVFWRKHFIDTMNPKFMIDFWDINRSI
jgi:hypothetical protein